MNDQQTAENPFETAEAWEPFLDRYIREEGNYVLTITEATNGTTSNGNPQIFVQLEGSAGSIRDWVIYNEKNLGKVVGIFTASGAQMPQPGEFDPADKNRLTEACIARLVGRKVGTVVRKEDSYKDPGKTVLRVQGYVVPGRITDDIPADTRGLPDVPAATAGASSEPDLPF